MDDSKEDRLSLNPMLSRICEYLDAPSVNRCINVNRSFNSTINRNWNKMARVRADVRINVVAPETNDSHMLISCRILADEPELMIRVYLQTAKCDAESSKSRMFLNDLRHRFEPMEIAVGVGNILYNADLFATPTEQLYFTWSGSGRIELLRTALDCIFERFEIIKFSLGDSEGGPFQQIKDAELTCIRDALIANKPNRRCAEETAVEMCLFNPLHSDIIRALDLKSAVLQNIDFIMDTDTLKSLPTDSRTDLFLILYYTHMDRVLQYFLEEWLAGCREITSLRFNAYGLPNVPKAIENSLSKFPKATQEDFYSNHSEGEQGKLLTREKEPKKMRVTLKDKWFRFHTID